MSEMLNIRLDNQDKQRFDTIWNYYQENTKLKVTKSDVIKLLLIEKSNELVINNLKSNKSDTS